MRPIELMELEKLPMGPCRLEAVRVRRGAIVYSPGLFVGSDVEVSEAALVRRFGYVAMQARGLLDRSKSKDS